MDITLETPIPEERPTRERRVAPIRLQALPPIEREEIVFELEEEDGADRDRR